MLVHCTRRSIGLAGLFPRLHIPVLATLQSPQLDRLWALCGHQRGPALGARMTAEIVLQACYSIALSALQTPSDYHVTLTADHGNVAVRGIGRVADGILAEERGVRARLYTDLLLRDRTVSTIQGAIAWPGAGLPPTISAALAPPGSAFTTEGQYLVAHGGIDLRDVMVPCISLRPTGREEHR